jgi:hypothetical protein
MNLLPRGGPSSMKDAATLAEFLLNEPEILAWLEVNPDHRHERELLRPAQVEIDASQHPQPRE